MFIAFLSSCNLDFKEAKQVSLNIQEANEKKVFVTEYKLDNIQQLDNKFSFPIQSSWEEKARQLALDNRGKESYKILDSSSHLLVFNLNNKDTLFTENNFREGKWILFMEKTNNPIGSIRGMINIELLGKTVSDTASFTIYKQNVPHDIKNNLTPLFKFDLVR